MYMYIHTSSMYLLHMPLPLILSNTLRWVLVIFVLLVISVTVGNVFASSSLFINNSVVFSKLGSVNGLAVSLTAAVRCACHAVPVNSYAIL